jgi:hypothetical protein
VRHVVFVAVVALSLPVAAVAKLQGDLRMCGASGCRVVDRHEGHDAWPLLEDLSHGRKTGPVRPGPFYRLAIRERGANFDSTTMYLVANGAVARTDDGDGYAWTRLWVTPDAIARAVPRLRPFPAPRLVRVVVGDGRVARDPNSYLRLFRIPAGDETIPNPAGPGPKSGMTREIVLHAQRVKRHWIPVYLTSRRESPWSDSKSSLFVGKRRDLLLRDGEIVRIPHALAERIRRGESLR